MCTQQKKRAKLRMTADRNDKKENTWSLQENHKRKFFPLCRAALFTIVRTWKQPKCPSTEE